MLAPDYAPERGDVVWLNLNPRIGHEQSGLRPVLILSPRHYNQRSGLAIVVPFTTRIKGYPFEVAIPAGLCAQGVVLADQLKSVDWRVRQLKPIGALPENVVEEVLEKSQLLLE